MHDSLKEDIGATRAAARKDTEEDHATDKDESPATDKAEDTTDKAEDMSEAATPSLTGDNEPNLNLNVRTLQHGSQGTLRRPEVRRTWADGPCGRTPPSSRLPNTLNVTLLTVNNFQPKLTISPKCNNPNPFPMQARLNVDEMGEPVPASAKKAPEEQHKPTTKVNQAAWN